MKYLKLEIGNGPFDEPKRVLTFGKFKGHTKCMIIIHQETRMVILNGV
nr:MAG TPA: hypothetical protein [Ackermannviridae sp.]